jgi:(p)ppGpp synthase/HD superfamily hydrolase
MSHLMGVASLVLERGGSAEEAIAALLHDSVKIRLKITRVAPRPFARTSVMLSGRWCSRSSTAVPMRTRHPKPPWRERKEHYVEHLNTAPASVRLVSCADKLHNARAILTDLRSIGSSVFDRFNAGREGTLWYYRQLADAFTQLGPPSLAAELNRTVQEIERLGR